MTNETSQNEFVLLNSTLVDFVKSWSFNFTLGRLGQADNNSVAHGAGHAALGVNGTSGAAIMCCVFILVFITGYMGFRIYRQRKFFSYYWSKQYGNSLFDPHQNNQQDSEDNFSQQSQQIDQPQPQSQQQEFNRKPHQTHKKLNLDKLDTNKQNQNSNNNKKEHTDRNLLNNDTEKASSYRSNNESDRGKQRRKDKMVDPRDVDLEIN